MLFLNIKLLEFIKSVSLLIILARFALLIHWTKAPNVDDIMRRCLCSLSILTENPLKITIHEKHFIDFIWLLYHSNIVCVQSRTTILLLIFNKVVYIDAENIGTGTYIFSQEKNYIICQVSLITYFIAYLSERQRYWDHSVTHTYIVQSFKVSWSKRPVVVVSWAIFYMTIVYISRRDTYSF